MANNGLIVKRADDKRMPSPFQTNLLLYNSTQDCFAVRQMTS